MKSNTDNTPVRSRLIVLMAALGLFAFAPSVALAQWGDDFDEPGFDDELLNIGNELEQGFDELERDFDNLGNDLERGWDDIDFDDDPIEYRNINRELGMDDEWNVDMNDPEVMRTRDSLGHLGAAGTPTLDQLIDSADSVAVIRIGDTSTALSGACDVFYGATFNVDRVLMGSGVESTYNRIGRAESLSDDECDLVGSSRDVAPFFYSGERYIIFTNTRWGDVVLPYSMLNDVDFAIRDR